MEHHAGFSVFCVSKKSFRHAFDQSRLWSKENLHRAARTPLAHTGPIIVQNSRYMSWNFDNSNFIFPPAGGKTLRGPLTKDACVLSSRGFLDSLTHRIARCVSFSEAAFFCHDPWESPKENWQHCHLSKIYGKPVCISVRRWNWKNIISIVQ